MKKLTQFLSYVGLVFFLIENQALALDCSDSRVRRVIVPNKTLIYHAQKKCTTPPEPIFQVEEGFNIKNQILGKIDCGNVNYTIFVSDHHPENESLYYMTETESLLCL